MPFFGRTPATELEYYFEMRNGQACFLSEKGIYFFSHLPDTLRRSLVIVPTLAGCVLLVFILASYVVPNFKLPWIPPDDGLGFSLFFLVFPIFPWAIGKAASYGRSEAFGGQSLENLLSNSKYRCVRRDW